MDMFLSLHCQVQRDWQSEGLVQSGSKCPEKQWLCRLAPSVQVKMQCSFWEWKKSVCFFKPLVAAAFLSFKPEWLLCRALQALNGYFFLQALHGFSLVPSSLQWLFVNGSPSLQWLFSDCKPVMAILQWYPESEVFFDSKCPHWFVWPSSPLWLWTHCFTTSFDSLLSLYHCFQDIGTFDFHEDILAQVNCRKLLCLRWPTSGLLMIFAMSWCMSATSWPRDPIPKLAMQHWKLWSKGWPVWVTWVPLHCQCSTTKSRLQGCQWTWRRMWCRQWTTWQWSRRLPWRSLPSHPACTTCLLTSQLVIGKKWRKATCWTTCESSVKDWRNWASRNWRRTPRRLPLQCCFMCMSQCTSTHCLAHGASMDWQMTLPSALLTLMLVLQWPLWECTQPVPMACKRNGSWGGRTQHVQLEFGSFLPEDSSEVHKYLAAVWAPYWFEALGQKWVLLYCGKRWPPGGATGELHGQVHPFDWLPALALWKEKLAPASFQFSCLATAKHCWPNHCCAFDHCTSYCTSFAWASSSGPQYYCDGSHAFCTCNWACFYCPQQWDCWQKQWQDHCGAIWRKGFPGFDWKEGCCQSKSKGKEQC